MDRFRIALAQLAPVLFEKEKNLEKAEAAIRQAAARGASAILFPELYLTGYALAGRSMEMAETVDGPCARRLAHLAGEHRVAVLMGFAERSAEGGKVYDSVLVADAKGRVCGTYRKVHLFKAETGWFEPGGQAGVMDFGLGRAGLLVCYDLEFPEAARDLALRGARWIATCTGNMVPNEHLQEIYVQSRAAENRLWVAVANRTGREEGYEFFGGSALADPHGRMVARAGSEETLLLAEIDLQRAEDARQNADYLADRRPEQYRSLLGQENRGEA